MSERYIVDLPIHPASADVAGAPAQLIEHYVRSVGRPEDASSFVASASPLSGDGWVRAPLTPTAEMKLASKRYARSTKITTGPGYYRAMILALIQTGPSIPATLSDGLVREVSEGDFEPSGIDVRSMASELLAAREALRPFADRFDAWSKVSPGPYEDEEYSPKLFRAMQIAARALSGNRSGK